MWEKIKVGVYLAGSVAAIVLLVLVLTLLRTPSPDPGPVPVPAPEPVPPPAPSPVTEPGLRILIVHESSAPTVAFNVITAGDAVRNYVKEKCAKDGVTPAFRVLDQHDSPALDMEWVREAMKRPRASLPWIVISNAPKGGYEGPLPLGNPPTDALNLIKKIAEPSTLPQPATPPVMPPVTVPKTPAPPTTPNCSGGTAQPISAPALSAPRLPLLRKLLRR